MFTADKDSGLNKELIEQAIEYNEDERNHYNTLENYYRGEHEIKNRSKPPTTKNTRVVINHAKYITDINVGYLLGNPVDYIADEGVNIENIMEEYHQEVISDIDSELAKEISVFGKAYELVYNNENDVKSAIIDPRNAICIYDDTVSHSKLYGITYKIKEEKGKKKVYERVTVYTEDTVYEDCVDTSGDIAFNEENGTPHQFGKIPLIEYRNNSEEMGDFEQVISLIDAYNILQSDRINDKEQLVEAILVGYGFKMENNQLEKLKQDRVMFGLPPKNEAEVEYLIKTMDEGQVDILRQNLEADIHKISQTPNMSDENFAGNNSGVAIRYKLLAFEQSVKNKERYFEKGLKERFEIYNNYLVSISKGTQVDIHKVKVSFKRNLPQNDYEASQMVRNLSGLVPEETLLAQLSFIEDASKEVDKNSQEQVDKYTRENANFGTPEPTENTEE